MTANFQTTAKLKHVSTEVKDAALSCAAGANRTSEASCSFQTSSQTTPIPKHTSTEVEDAALSCAAGVNRTSKSSCSSRSSRKTTVWLIGKTTPLQHAFNNIESAQITLVLSEKELTSTQHTTMALCKSSPPDV